MSEYSSKHKMIDNKMVHDDHGRKGKIQCDSHAAIKRVMQHGHDRLDYEGHNGSMAGGWKHGKGSHEHSSFKRGGGQLTPRKA
jgi:hypothetical protein